MAVNPNAPLTITGYKWVPDFAQGFVRDLRPRWACEEIGLDYAERLIDVMKKPEGYAAEQPFEQVPVLDDEGVMMFESGAILLHLGKKDERLLPKDPQLRATAISWVFAAYNSIEPSINELGNIDFFAKDEEWARLRRPGLVEFLGARLDKLAAALGEKEYLIGRFSAADIAMTEVLRPAREADAMTVRKSLCAYVDRCTARPAYARALDAQMSAFRNNPPPASAP
ncbi:MAG: glutathione S-transferase family protein [Parvularculaceae bacterium]